MPAGVEARPRRDRQSLAADRAGAARAQPARLRRAGRAGRRHRDRRRGAGRAAGGCTSPTTTARPRAPGQTVAIDSRRPRHLEHDRPALAATAAQRCTTSSTPPPAARRGRAGGPSASRRPTASTPTSPAPRALCAARGRAGWLRALGLPARLVDARRRASPRSAAGRRGEQRPEAASLDERARCDARRPSAYWYLTRSTGAVALLLLTLDGRARRASTCAASAATRWPRFVIDGLHRNIALLALVFLVVHILTSRARQLRPDLARSTRSIPFVGSYRPFWLGLGAVAFDLLLAVIDHEPAAPAPRLPQLARGALARLRPLAGGAAARPRDRQRRQERWLLLLTHRLPARGLAAVLVRVAAAGRERSASRGAALGGTARFALFLALWLPGGPLGSEWARRSGTPSKLLGQARQPRQHRRRSGSRDRSVPRGATPAAAAAARASRTPASRRPRAPPGGARRRSRSAGAATAPAPARADRRGRARGPARPRRRGLPDGAEAARRRRRALGGRTVVVNAVEGEPASAKDRTLLERRCPTSCSTARCSRPRSGRRPGESCVCVSERAAAALEPSDCGDRRTRRAERGVARTASSRFPTATSPARSRRSSTTWTAGPRSPPSLRR